MARPRLSIRACTSCKTPFTVDNCSPCIFKAQVGICRKCQKIKSAEYWERKGSEIKFKQQKYRAEHPELFKQYQKRRYKDMTPEQKRDSDTWGAKGFRKYKLGVNPEQFDAMLIAQDGRCEMCNVPLIEACLDHDHKTMKVRDILCHNCNKLLGHAKENKDILLSAIRYLEKHTIDSSN